MFRVIRFTRSSTGVGTPLYWKPPQPSSAHDHCLVPAEKTVAPDGAR